MKEAAAEYYRHLRDDYDHKIRQLVPRYDDMVGTVVDLVARCAPASALDLGAGTGTVTAAVLQRVPGARVVAVEVSDAMAADADNRLAPYGARAQVIHQDVLDYAPDKGFDVVLSSLVLHNLPLPEKTSLLAAIHDWLLPGGVFVWADLVRFTDRRMQQHFVSQRRDHALAHGAPHELVRANFEKEANDDHPLTIEETLSLGRRVGFDEGQVVWAHDTFAITVFGTGTP